MVLEVPDPIALALLGIATVALPDPQAPALLLNLDVAAVVDLGQQLIAVDASLRDSNVAGFPSPATCRCGCRSAATRTSRSPWEDSTRSSTRPRASPPCAGCRWPSAQVTTRG